MPTQFRIPLGDWIESAVEWMNINWEPFFDAISTAIRAFIEGLTALFTLAPALALIAVLAFVAHYFKGWKFALFTALSFLLVVSMDLWYQTMSTLSMVLTSSLIAIVIGVLLGIWSSSSKKVSSVIKPIMDFMQTMPAFVYLIPAIIFFGIGVVPGTIATVIFAMPPAVRLTELGLRSVDPEAVEAGEAFGASPAKILWDVKLPLALPSIMSGVNQVIMLALSMVVTAGIVGAGGLGSIVYQGVTRLDIGLGFEGGIAVVVLAIFLDRISQSLGKKANKRISHN